MKWTPLLHQYGQIKGKKYIDKNSTVSDMAFIIVPAMYKHYTFKHHKWTPPLNGHWNLG